MGKSRILVVDDDREIIAILKSELAKEGYEVLASSEGKEALEMIKAEKPHLIILDIVLPGMDGYEILDRLKKDDETEKIPVIMLTDMGLDEDIKKGINMGAQHYLTKPLRTRMLIRCIESTLNQGAL